MEENFIPWEQIEPLLEEGMVGHDLAVRLRALLGLSDSRHDDTYTLQTVLPGATFSEALRGGVRLIRLEQSQWLSNDATDEPVS